LCLQEKNALGNLKAILEITIDKSERLRLQNNVKDEKTFPTVQKGISKPDLVKAIVERPSQVL
jgi:hypothetical protein